MLLLEQDIIFNFDKVSKWLDTRHVSFSGNLPRLNTHEHAAAAAAALGVTRRYNPRTTTILLLHTPTTQTEISLDVPHELYTRFCHLVTALCRARCDT